MDDHFKLALENLKKINPEDLSPEQQQTLLKVVSSKICSVQQPEKEAPNSNLVNCLKFIITLL